MNIKSGWHGFVAKSRKYRMVFMALILGTALVSIPLDRANAFYNASSSGSIGSVTLPTIYVGDRALTCPMIYDYTVCPVMLNLFANQDAIAYRIPGSSGNQYIQAIYFVEQWEVSKWVIVAHTDVLSGLMSATQTSVRFVSPNITLSQVARGYFRFSWMFYWYSASGTILGSTIIYSNLSSDHVCVTTARLCQSYAGYVRTGGYLTNAW